MGSSLRLESFITTLLICEREVGIVAYHLPKSLVSTVMKYVSPFSPSYIVRQIIYRYSALVFIIPV